MAVDVSRASLPWVLTMLLAGCIFDEDRPCDENQVEQEGLIGGCRCVDNAVIKPNGIGCTLCGENEAVVNNACACLPGFARLSAGGPCSRSELGQSCSATVACGADFPYCTPEGYCTKSGCTGAGDCAGDYACETTANPPYCSRPPTGVGMTCTTSADCSSYDAKYCGQGRCAVTGCKSGGTRCHGESRCCDYSALGAVDVCVPLENGMCPYTMADPVTP